MLDCCGNSEIAHRLVNVILVLVSLWPAYRMCFADVDFQCIPKFRGCGHQKLAALFTVSTGGRDEQRMRGAAGFASTAAKTYKILIKPESAG